MSRPLKVEEGLLLGVLEVAAGRGNVELAEAAWQLLERSLALPNPPSSAAAGGQQQDLAAAAAADDEQLEWQLPPPQQQAGGARESADSRQQQQHQQQQSIDELEAMDAAEAAQQLGGAPHRAERQPPPSWQAVEAAAAAAEAEPRGMRAPSVVSHLALIHSYATAGRAEPMLAAVARLVEVSSAASAGGSACCVCVHPLAPALCAGTRVGQHVRVLPDGARCPRTCLCVEWSSPHAPWLALCTVQAHPSERATAASYHAGLPMCVDALAASGAEGCDAAFHLLRDWAHEVGALAGGADAKLLPRACGHAGLARAGRPPAAPASRSRSGLLCADGRPAACTCLTSTALTVLGPAQQGRPVLAEQLNLVVAACCQTDDLRCAAGTLPVPAAGALPAPPPGHAVS